MNQIPRFCGVALVVGFFLPFISMGPISCSGLDLAKIGMGSNPAAEMMGDMGGESEESSGGPIVWQLAILVLIPLAGLVGAIAHKKPIYLACGAVPILIFAYYMIGGGGDAGGGMGEGGMGEGGMGDGGILKVMGAGAWLCLIAAIGMLCTAGKAGAAMATEDGGGGMDYGGDSGGDAEGT